MIRTLLLMVSIGLLLFTPALVAAETVDSPWDVTLESVGDHVVNAAAADSSRAFIVGSKADDFAVNAFRNTGAADWADLRDFKGFRDEAFAVDVRYVRVAVAGKEHKTAGNSDRFLILYSAVDGRVLCSDRIGGAGADQFNAVAQTVGALIAGGKKQNDWNVWATNTTRCEKIWQKNDGTGQVFGLATSIYNRVIVGGEQGGANKLFTVVLHNTTNGNQLWKRQAGTTASAANAVAIDSTRGYAAGVVSTGGNGEAFLAVYDLASGAEVCSATDVPAGGYDRSAYQAMAVKDGTIVAVGYAADGGGANKPDWLVTARSASNCSLIWQATFDANGEEDRAKAVAIANGFVEVVGFAKDGSGNKEMHVKIYTLAGNAGAAEELTGGPVPMPDNLNGGPDSEGTGAAAMAEGSPNLPAGALAQFYAAGQRGTAGSLAAFLKAYVITP